MTTDFERSLAQLQEEYCELNLEEKQKIKLYIKQKDPILSVKIDYLKHELLRLERRRVQLMLTGKSTQVIQIENKILDRKKHFLEIFRMMNIKRKGE